VPRPLATRLDPDRLVLVASRSSRGVLRSGPMSPSRRAQTRRKTPRLAARSATSWPGHCLITARPDVLRRLLGIPAGDWGRSRRWLGLEAALSPRVGRVRLESDIDPAPKPCRALQLSSSRPCSRNCAVRPAALALIQNRALLFAGNRSPRTHRVSLTASEAARSVSLWHMQRPLRCRGCGH